MAALSIPAASTTNLLKSLMILDLGSCRTQTGIGVSRIRGALRAARAILATAVSLRSGWRAIASALPEPTGYAAISKDPTMAVALN